MSEKNKNHGRSPAFDLEALSKAYEQSLNDVTLGGKDIPIPEARKKPSAPVRELKSFVPQDYRPRTEATPEHDKIVDKIKADRRKRSHSVWTDTPVLKPKKSVWIDEGDDEEAPVRQQAPAPSRPAPAKPAARPQRPSAKKTQSVWQQDTGVQKTQSVWQDTGVRRNGGSTAAKTAKTKLPDDIVMPLPVMMEQPKPEPLPDFGTMVEAAGDKPKKDSVVPLLNEKPRKQELVMRVDPQGDTRVRSIPQRVNKQKIMVDMSGYRQELPAEEDGPNKRTVSLEMPLWKMKKDIPEPPAEKKPENAEAVTAEQPAVEKQAEAAPAAEERPEAAEEKVVVSLDKAVPAEETEAGEVKAEDVVEDNNVGDTVTAEKEAAVQETEAEQAAVAEEAAEEEQSADNSETVGEAAETAEGEYNFSAMIKKVRAEKKDRVREEFDKSDVTEHTLITEKAQRHGVEPQYIMPQRKLTKRKKPITHELEFQFINCIMCICMIFGVFFSLLYMERESGFINSENRNLAEFPEFSISDYFKGEYTRGIDDYFTDTIPGREELKKFGAAYDRVKGIDLGDTKVSGTHKKAEKEKLDEEKLAAVTTVTANTDPKAVTTAKSDDDSSKAAASTKKEEVVKLPEILDDGVFEGDVIVFGKGSDVRAVSGYYGTFETGALYAQTINKYKEAMPEVNVYNMTIPTSSAYYIPNNFKDSVADQKDNIDNIASELKGIINVDVFNAIGAHTDEYIYSRTDHHWQPLGAYYAGKAFAEKAGVKYPELKTYQKCEISDFLGTMYAYSNYDSELAANPDTFVYYKPDNEYKTFYYDTDFTNGEESSLFFDFAEGVNCYSAILGQDEEIAEITTDANNGRTLVIFKDSFGNALVPFFTHSFEKIYVCDFRYFDENAVEFCHAVGCTDLLFSISITSCSTETHITAINNDRIRESAVPLTKQQEPAESSAESAAESMPETNSSEVREDTFGAESSTPDDNGYEY